jgi:transposase IS116/IS110/IS902 family protein
MPDVSSIAAAEVNKWAVIDQHKLSLVVGVLTHLASLDAQIAAIDHQLEQIATHEPWADPVAWLCSFRGISTHTALGLLAEIGAFRRFAHPRELMSYLGLTPSEYSSGDLSIEGTSPRPATATRAGSSSRRPGTTATNPANPPEPPDSQITSLPRSLPVPGRRRSASTTATASFPNTGSVRPSQTSPSPASSPASSGPR